MRLRPRCGRNILLREGDQQAEIPHAMAGEGRYIPTKEGVKMSPNDLKDIAKLGGGIRLQASSLSPIDLKDIARRMVAGGSLFYITGASSLSPVDLKDIARIGKGHVVLEF